MPNIFLIPIFFTMLVAGLVGLAARRSQSRGLGLIVVLIPGALAVTTLSPKGDSFFSKQA
jgi:hypothetical protein